MVAAAARATTGSISPPVWTAQAVESIITDPTRGSHDAYAVTTNGVFYMPNSIPSASNPAPTLGQHRREQHPQPGVFHLRPELQPDDRHRELGHAQPGDHPVRDRRRLAISDPQQSDQPQRGLLTRCCTSARVTHVSDGSGVFQSLDNGATWTLFPNLTYGAVAKGGDLPHVAVTDLDVSLGNVDANTGMPTLAGPDQAFVFNGTLTSGSPVRHGDQSDRGRWPPGTPSPAPASRSGTTILSVNTSTISITLSANATA